MKLLRTLPLPVTLGYALLILGALGLAGGINALRGWESIRWALLTPLVIPGLALVLRYTPQRSEPPPGTWQPVWVRHWLAVRIGLVVACAMLTFLSVSAYGECKRVVGTFKRVTYLREMIQAVDADTGEPIRFGVTPIDERTDGSFPRDVTRIEYDPCGPVEPRLVGGITLRAFTVKVWSPGYEDAVFKLTRSRYGRRPVDVPLQPIAQEEE